MQIDIKKVITKTQEAQLKREIKDHIHRIILDEASNEALKIAKLWIKDNPDFIHGAIEEEMKKAIIKMAKTLYVSQDRY